MISVVVHFGIESCVEAHFGDGIRTKCGFEQIRYFAFTGSPNSTRGATRSRDGRRLHRAQVIDDGAKYRFGNE